MSAEDYCEELLYLKEQLNHYRDHLKKTLSGEDITVIRARDYDGTGVRDKYWKGGVFNHIEKRLDSIPTATSEYKDAAQEYLDRAREFMQMLKRIKTNSFQNDLRCTQYLTSRYIFGMSLNAVADKMGLSYETVRRLKKPALEALQKIMDQDGTSAGNS